MWSHESVFQGDMTSQQCTSTAPTKVKVCMNALFLMQKLQHCILVNVPECMLHQDIAATKFSIGPEIQVNIYVACFFDRIFLWITGSST